MIFEDMMSKWTCLKYFEIVKMVAILRFGWSFQPELVLETEYNSIIGHAIPYILSFFSMV